VGGGVAGDDNVFKLKVIFLNLRKELSDIA
jgi:hypothetical protein